MKLYEVADVDFDTEDQNLSVNTDDKEDGEQEVDYDTVFYAVTKHFDCDPESIDDQDDETKEKVYSMMDKCWDSEENKVPDSCPIDVVSDSESEYQDDEEDDDEDHDKLDSDEA